VQNQSTLQLIYQQVATRRNNEARKKLEAERARLPLLADQLPRSEELPLVTAEDVIERRKLCQRAAWENGVERDVAEIARIVAMRNEVFSMVGELHAARGDGMTWRQVREALRWLEDRLYIKGHQVRPCRFAADRHRFAEIALRDGCKPPILYPHNICPILKEVPHSNTTGCCCCPFLQDNLSGTFSSVPSET